MLGGFRHSGSFILSVMLLALASCSASHTPIGPDVLLDDSYPKEERRLSSENASRSLLGLWRVRIRPSTGSVELIPCRTAELHFNVLPKLETAPCIDCLKVAKIQFVPPDEVKISISIRHPYPGKKALTGFDVRGIFISGADYSFPVNGRTMAWSNDEPMLLNPDGYTTLFNPVEFGPGTSEYPILEYVPGKFASGGDLSSTLNPFIAYSVEKPRRMFDSYEIETRTLHLRLPDGPFNEVEFGYAVDASWVFVEDVKDPLTDFPVSANCLEAYDVNILVSNELAEWSWSYAPVQVEVFDHQGQQTISSVTVEAPDLFNGVIPLQFSLETTDGAFLFQGSIGNQLAVSPGIYPLLVRVEDTEADANLGEVAAWNVQPVKVTYGWAQTWGGDSYDENAAVECDTQGNIYVAGHFRNTVDFNPGPAVDIRTSNGTADAFLVKFDDHGAFQWVRTWGGAGPDKAHDICISPDGSLLVTGDFNGTVDFDPGSGTNEQTSHGMDDAFVCKFTQSGDFCWARCWGGAWGDLGSGIASDANNRVYCAGTFAAAADFDPGPENDIHTAVDENDTFLSCFDSEGVFQWAKTWGAEGDDWAEYVSSVPQGYLLVIGWFYETIDLDPGDGVNEYTPEGFWASYVSTFDSAGNYLTSRVWDSEFCVYMQALAVDGDGDINLTGSFGGTCDFDPGPGICEKTSKTGSDNFLVKLDANADFEWVRIWDGGEYANDIAVDSNNNLYVTGGFLHWKYDPPIDFDPGPGIDLHYGNGVWDVFLTSFDKNGNHRWASTWGGTGEDRGFGVALSPSGAIYVCGEFGADVDFDPGTGVDRHQSEGSDDAFLAKLSIDGLW